MTFDLPRRLAAEALGTGLLVATVVGSGIMADNLAGGNVALALLGNTLPTGAILVVLILSLAPISGAHFNPAVSLVMALTGGLSWRDLAPLCRSRRSSAAVSARSPRTACSICRCSSSPLRPAPGRRNGSPNSSPPSACWSRSWPWCASGLEAIPYAVGLYITAAYWFTASTSFANPAVTIARALTATFAGIAPGHVLPFILAQLAGALAGMALMGWLIRPNSAASEPLPH